MGVKKIAPFCHMLVVVFGGTATSDPSGFASNLVTNF